MTQSPASLILDAYCKNHQRILVFAEKLSQEQLTWRPAPDVLSIAFNLWHMARWADHLQAAIPGMTPVLSQRLSAGRQVWEEQGLGKTWGFDSAAMGYAGTGMGMDESSAVRLEFPPKKILLNYARLAFAAAERALQAVDETQFITEEQPQPATEGIWESGGTVGSAIFSHLIHDSRHLGMMECLLGQQMDSGSATV